MRVKISGGAVMVGKNDQGRSIGSRSRIAVCEVSPNMVKKVAQEHPNPTGIKKLRDTLKCLTIRENLDEDKKMGGAAPKHENRKYIKF